MAAKKTIFKISLLVIILLQTGILLQSKPITLREPLRFSEHPTGIGQKELSGWLREHPTQGLTLLSVLANDSLVFDAHIKNSRLIYESSWKFWKESLENPSSIAERVIISPNNLRDAVWKASQGNNEFFDGFNLVFENEHYLVFDKRGI